MTRIRAPRALSVLALAALVVPTTAANAAVPCPPSEFACSDFIESTADPVFARTCVDLPGQSSALAQDGVQAVIETHSTGPNLDPSFVTFIDDYVLVNVPAGQNVTLHAQLWLDGFVYRPADPDSDLGSVAQIAASLTDGTLAIFDSYDRVAAAQSGLTQVIAGLDIALNIVTGTPFRIHANVFSLSKGAGQAKLKGRLFFFYTVQGADVHGCKGYRQFAGLPVLPTSWGRVKGAYR